MKKRIWGTLDPFFEPGSIMGRLVANEGFLRGLAAEDPFDEYHFFLADQGLKNRLESFFKDHLPAFAPKARVLFRWDLPDALRRVPYHCFHLSDCIMRPGHMARLRNKYAPKIFPVTSVTHSLSYADYGQSFLKHLGPWCTPRDAIIATSRPGAEVVRSLFRRLRENFDLDKDRFPEPSVERIPLGIDPSVFPAPSPERKSKARRACGFADNKTVLLVFGRIQHHSKMDPLPLFRALHRLFMDGLDRDSVKLVMAGWTEDNDDYPDSLKIPAESMGLDLELVRRPDERLKTDLFHGADVFVSIADNPQETFGITILEAGAMGLPVIASEYDGYRDLVLPGETGLLVPTIGPADTDMTDTLAPILYDNQYHLLLAQQTAVEVPALAEALSRLIRDPDLRAEMGTRAREHVLRKYSWPRIIRKHVELWDELWTRPLPNSLTDSLKDARHPLHIPYAEVFGHYTTRRLGPDTLLQAGRAGQAAYRGLDFPIIYSGVAFAVDEESLRKILFLARKPRTVAEIMERARDTLPETEPEKISFILSWALKHDFLERVEP